jgi:hypothetical protein
MQRHAPLRIEGKSDTAIVKREIQGVLRQIVIARDGGCILRNVRQCGGEAGYTFLEGGVIGKVKGLVLQADHLITRANSATYADSRLVVCLCRRCHAWKSLGGNRNKAQYDALVKTLLPPERVKLWEACEGDSWRPHRTSSYDWKLALAALKQELYEAQLPH